MFPRWLYGYLLIVFALSCSLGFLLAANAGLFVMLALTNLLLNTGLRAAAFESAKRAVKGFVFFYDDTRHCSYPPSGFGFTSGYCLMHQTIIAESSH